MEPRALATEIAQISLRLAAAKNVQLTLTGEDVALERPRSKEHGDWATSIALKLAKDFGQNPRELATEIAELLSEVSGVQSVDIAGPGFINITVDAGVAGGLLATIVEAGEEYGHGQELSGETINLEFVSANPTGPPAYWPHPLGSAG